jgi:DNA repair protein RadC
MSVIPFRKKAASVASADGKQDRRSVRLKEITAVYRDVTLRCPVGAGLAETPAIHSAQEVYQLFAFLEFETKEHFFALHLSARNEILCLDQVSMGSLTASIVTPREVYKSALLSSAAAVLFVHNHPSGDPTPSADDHRVHLRLQQAGELLGIRVLDSLVIGSRGRYLSLATPAGGADDGELPLFI